MNLSIALGLGARSFVGQLANSVTQFGVTFTFASPRIVGQYANGDWWALGPVSITSISPAGSVQTSGTDGAGATITNRVIHGTQVNPGNRSFASGGLTANNTGNAAQGWDSIVPPAAPTAPYVATANVDPGKTGVALDVTTGSVVKFVSKLSGLPVNNRPGGTDMVVLTVVDSVPSATAIRPGVSRASKASLINTGQFDLSVFNSFTPTASSPTYATALGWVERYIEASQPDSINNPSAKGANNHPEYGRDIGNNLHGACLALHLNFTADQKRALLSRMAAIADDFVSRAEEGGYTYGAGGGNQFKKSLICVVGAALGSNMPASWATWLSSGNRNVWGEDAQIFTVTGLDIALPRYTADGRPRSPYTYQMLGSAEWGEQPFGTPVVPGSRGHSGSNWTAFYREIVGGSLIGGALAVELTTGAKALWDHPEFWRYMDTVWHRRGEFTSNAAPMFDEEMLVAHRPAKVAAPALLAATIKNAAIAIRFDQALNETATAPATSAFVVNVNGSPATVSSVSIWRQNIGLTLASPVTGNDVVTVTYTVPGSNPARSVDGVNVASFSGQALTNGTDKVGGPNAVYPVVRFSPGVQQMLGGTNNLAAADSPTFTFALLKFQFTAAPAVAQEIFGSASGGNVFRIFMNTDRRMEFRISSQSGPIMRFYLPALSVNTVHDILISGDATQANITSGVTCYVNGALQTLQTTDWAGGAGISVGFSRVASSRLLLNFTSTWTFDLGAIWLDATTRVDLTVAGNRAKFTSSTSGNLDILTLGDGITGTQPALFTVGNVDQWNDGFGMNRGSHTSRFFALRGEVTLVSGSEWI